MNWKIISFLGIIGLFIFSHCESPATDWQLGGFAKADAKNPILLPDSTTRFLDPVTLRSVKWEAKDVFNPTSVVRNDTLFLLYRAEDFVGKYSGTSRIGLAYSLNGLDFDRYPEPIFYPDSNEYLKYEWEGGVEDPRLVESADGRYILTYTGYDGNIARLLIAGSKDLINWDRYGSVFKSESDQNRWSKSGSILTKLEGERLIAVKINNYYWMYFGDTDLFLARSSDLINWEPLLDESGEWHAVLSPRENKFDSDLVEPGPAALLTYEGILLIYNSRNSSTKSDTNLKAGTYAAGQALFSREDPSKLIERSENYFLRPERPYELDGQVNDVCFVEGLSRFRGQWFLYYGTADSKIAVAVSDQDIML